MKKLLLILFILFPPLAFAQPYSAQIVRYGNQFHLKSAGAPYTCNSITEGHSYADITSHTYNYCNGTAWVATSGASGVISGSGTSGQVALFNGTQTVTGDTGLTYSGTGATFALATSIAQFAEIAAPSATANTRKIYVNTSNQTCDLGENGFSICTDTSAFTASRTRTIVDASGIPALESGMPIGTGGMVGAVWRLLTACSYANSTGVTTTGTAEEVLNTCTVKGNTIDTDGAIVRVTIRGTTAANANNKVIRLRIGGIGGTNFYSTSNQVLNNGSWVAIVIIQRTGSAAQFGNGSGTWGTVANTSALAAGTESFAVDKDWVVTGTTTTAAGDVTVKSVFFEVAKP